MAPLTKIVALFEKNCRGAFLALFGEKVAHLNSKQLDTLAKLYKTLLITDVGRRSTKDGSISSFQL